MLPGKHIRQLENMERRQNRLKNLVLGTIFGLCTLIAGPVIHEAAHIAVMEVLNCFYSFSWGIGFGGVYGRVEPVCAPNALQLLVFYGAGYISTLVAGATLSVYAIKSEKLQRFQYQSIVAAGTGFLASTALSLSKTGDISNIAKILGLGSFYNYLIAIFVFFLISAVILRILETVWDI